MATTPIEFLSGLVVGSVESVAPDQVRVLLELDAPHATALNTGSPVAFPRLNGYVLIPHEAGATVAYIAWMGIERSPFPKRSGLKDFGLIDLPFPLRKMAVSPVATLTCKRNKSTNRAQYELVRGVVAFPSVGDQVLIPTAEQIEAIVGAKETDKRVRIGTSPLGSNTTIMVDPDKLFGRHLAVLGNTGSGKSCTVAGLIRWSMNAARQRIAESGKAGEPNARFIVLDPNGEYSAAFKNDAGKVRVFKVPPTVGDELPLEVPAWSWSGHEWTAISNAQPGAQRPLLMQGLRDLKSHFKSRGTPEGFVRPHIVAYAARVSEMLGRGSTAFAGVPRARFECARFIQSIAEECLTLSAGLEPTAAAKMKAIHAVASGVEAARKSGQFYNDFLVADLISIRTALEECAAILPVNVAGGAISEDAPMYCDVDLLPDHLTQIAVDQGAGVTGFVATLGLRIRSMLADQHLSEVVNRKPPTPFDKWLSNCVGENDATNGNIAIVDLSLIPSEVVHIVVAVLGRLVFEALQRYRRDHADGKALPTVLVLEEAHTFVRRGHEDSSGVATATALCRETFERIAREGRKFGLGLVVSSQRPAELSATVLAQCNTFILHRIVNDTDQALVGKLVPDNVAGLLEELPSLPSRQAILLGWATPIPVLVDIDELPKDQQPHSSDPDFWDVWTKKEPREIDWTTIATDWAGGSTRAGQAVDAGEVDEVPELDVNDI